MKSWNRTNIILLNILCTFTYIYIIVSNIPWENISASCMPDCVSYEIRYLWLSVCFEIRALIRISVLDFFSDCKTEFCNILISQFHFRLFRKVGCDRIGVPKIVISVETVSMRSVIRATFGLFHFKEDINSGAEEK